MGCHANLRLGVARCCYGAQPSDKSHVLGRKRDRSPAQLTDRKRGFFALGGGAKQAAVKLYKPAGVFDAGADAIEPGALVSLARSREWRPAKLFGIKPI